MSTLFLKNFLILVESTVKWAVESAKNFLLPLKFYRHIYKIPLKQFKRVLKA